MFRSKLLVILLSLTLPAVALTGSDDNKVTSKTLGFGGEMVFGGRPASVTKAAVTDTQLIMGPWGSGAPYNGQFQNSVGAPDWNGWTSIDLTQPTETHWQVATYDAIAGTYSAWCGDISFASCDDGLTDPVGGYGNSWKEFLQWRGSVADPLQPCTVDISALISHDTEPGYDYAYISVIQAGVTNDIWTRDGTALATLTNLQTTYLATDYEGPNHDEVVIQFRFTSDGGWSDEDCSWPTAGAVRVDDVQITLSNGTGYSHDFEDGTLGDFEVLPASGVGDFAKIWTGLQVPLGFDNGNHSPMVAFIDDGLVVPGTGGTECITWCYGPDGYIVNNTGGLAGLGGHIHNAIMSPVMAWPGAGYEGADFTFDAWRDEPLLTDSAGVFFTWSVRSTTSPLAEGIETEAWLDRNFVYYGPQSWVRMNQSVGDLMAADAQWAQVRMAVYELGWVWGWSAANGTPAPYFDNVRVTAFPYYGPALSATITELPHDNFPEGGTLDLVNLGQNNVRFDMGQRQNSYNTAVTPGDTIVIAVVPQRTGATLVGQPRLHWSLQRNPLFDPYRTAGLPDLGSTNGWPVMVNNQQRGNDFAFDLPDSGFLFPGDFLYYYFEATDVVGGVEQTVTMPADTTGFSNFDDPMAYPPIYKLHALPTITADPDSAGQYIQPGILFWDDAGAAGNRDEWYMAYRNLGLVAGVDYDIYYTNNPIADTGHGLAGRATVEQLGGYEALIYTSGVQTIHTLTMDSNGDGAPGFDDIGLLTSWLELGDKDMLLTGDDLAGDLVRSGGTGVAFLNSWMGVDLTIENVLPMINDQQAPLTEPEIANPVFQPVTQWEAVASDLPAFTVYYGSGGDNSTGLKRYDGVEILPGAQRLAQFLNPTGTPGMYPYSAATLNVRADFNSRVVSFPYDFQSIGTPQTSANKVDAPLPNRVQVLADILAYFGQSTGVASDVVVGAPFTTRHYPNPFNPSVTVSFTMPRGGHLSVKVFDIRGRLVRTLADGVYESGPGRVTWDGRTGRGEMAAAGVYFYEARTGEDTVVGKMALIK